MNASSTELQCPKCGSAQLTTNKKGFSGKKAVVGAVLTGGIGLLAGTLGSNKVKITCLSCGKVFAPGQGKTVSINTTPTVVVVPTVQQKIEMGNDNIDERIIQINQSRGLLDAVKFCQDAKGLGLGDAAEYVRKLIGQHGQASIAENASFQQPESTFPITRANQSAGFKSQTPLSKKSSTGKKVLIGIGALLIIGFIGSSIEKNKDNSDSSGSESSTSSHDVPTYQSALPTSTSTSTPKSYPYEYITGKNEERKLDGKMNTLKVYFAKKPVDRNLLIDFCLNKKGEWENGVINTIVFFDNKKFAKLPKNPVSAGYIDERQLRHIVAQYDNTSFNGYRKLTVYADNAWSSSPEQIDLRDR